MHHNYIEGEYRVEENGHWGEWQKSPKRFQSKTSSFLTGTFEGLRRRVKNTGLFNLRSKYQKQSNSETEQQFHHTFETPPPEKDSETVRLIRNIGDEMQRIENSIDTQIEEASDLIRRKFGIR